MQIFIMYELDKKIVLTSLLKVTGTDQFKLQIVNDRQNNVLPFFVIFTNENYINIFQSINQSTLLKNCVFYPIFFCGLSYLPGIAK